MVIVFFTSHFNIHKFRTIAFLIKYILVPLLIIYYINTNYGFFYNEDTSLHTVVNYIANPSGTNYLSEKHLTQY